MPSKHAREAAHRFIRKAPLGIKMQMVKPDELYAVFDEFEQEIIERCALVAIEAEASAIFRFEYGEAEVAKQIATAIRQLKDQDQDHG